MSIIGIIPARYHSSRFPGKPLIKIGNKTMIEWTYSQVSSAKNLDEIVVATEDERIYDHVKSFGKVVMTSDAHQTGTDRIVETLNYFPNYNYVINIQGDEPGIDPELIDGVALLKKSNPHWEMTTAAFPIKNKEESNDPNRVKVIFDKSFKAIYFSRSCIPSNFKNNVQLYRHLGIYAYNAEFIKKFPDLPKSNLEESESLEQLRAIENGYSIGVFITNDATLAIDTKEDLSVLIEEFKKKGII